jgi:hypothetical protein
MEVERLGGFFNMNVGSSVFSVLSNKNKLLGRDWEVELSAHVHGLNNSGSAYSLLQSPVQVLPVDVLPSCAKLVVCR